MQSDEYVNWQFLWCWLFDTSDQAGVLGCREQSLGTKCRWLILRMPSEADYAIQGSHRSIRSIGLQLQWSRPSMQLRALHQVCCWPSSFGMLWLRKQYCARYAYTHAAKCWGRSRAARHQLKWQWGNFSSGWEACCPSAASVLIQHQRFLNNITCPSIKSFALLTTVSSHACWLLNELSALLCSTWCITPSLHQVSKLCFCSLGQKGVVNAAQHKCPQVIFCQLECLCSYSTFLGQRSLKHTLIICAEDHRMACKQHEITATKDMTWQLDKGIIAEHYRFNDFVLSCQLWRSFCKHHKHSANALCAYNASSK